MRCSSHLLFFLNENHVNVSEMITERRMRVPSVLRYCHIVCLCIVRPKVSGWPDCRLNQRERHLCLIEVGQRRMRIPHTHPHAPAPFLILLINIRPNQCALLIQPGAQTFAFDVLNFLSQSHLLNGSLIIVGSNLHLNFIYLVYRV